MNMSTSTKSGIGCLVLFALPFAAVGIGMTGWAGYDVYTWQRMQSWMAVPAQILELDLHENHGDDSTTYQVTARYEYYYDELPYYSDRVCIGFGADNIGSFHQDLYAQLQAQQRTDSVVCYVNPERPDEAILSRDLRWGMLAFKGLFGLIFGGAGIGLMAAGFTGGRKMATVAKQRAAHPEEPWRWDTAATGVIPSGGKGGVIAAWVFAAFWNAISLPAAIMAYLDGVFSRDPVALLILLFPLVGSGLLAGAIYATLKHLKYGISELRMAEFPAVLGGALRGVVHIPRAIEPQDGFRLTVSCIEETVTGSGKNRKTHTKTLWQDTRSIARPAQSGPDGTDIPVLFALPYDMPATGELGEAKIYWTLEVHAPTAGVDYSADFKVPAYKTEASRADFKLDEELLTPFLEEGHEDRELAAARVFVEEAVNGGLTIRIPAPRNVTMAIMATLFGVVFAGVGYGVGMLIDDDSIMTTLFGLLFFCIGALMLFWSLKLWFDGWSIQTGQGALRIRGGLFTLGALHELRATDVESIDSYSNTSVGNTMLYNIRLTTTAGKKIHLAKLLPNQRLAQRLIDRITATL
jgi:hypothetical protein